MIQVLVVTGGDGITRERLAPWSPFHAVVAADSGGTAALELGHSPDLIVGDFDSISPESLMAMGDVETIPVSADKDETDLELALDVAVARFDPDHIVIAGGGGGRLDHLLGNAGAATGVAEADVTWVLRHEIVYPVRSARTIRVGAGSTVSIVPWGEARVSTEALRWQLSNEWLDPTKARGVSNIAVSDEISVTVHEGHVLVIVNG